MTAPVLQDRGAIARGYLLVGVFYVHALYGVFGVMGGNPATAIASGVQLKLLAPAIPLFFLLSGMSAPYFHRKGWQSALRPSLTLLLLAESSHLVGVALDFLVDPRWYGWRWLFHIAVKPLVTGTGYSNFIGWFFVVLAFSRVFAYLFLKSKRWFFVMTGVAALAAFASLRLGLPDNIFEWRNWPACTLFFLIGMRIRPGFRVGPWVALTALAGALVLSWFNRPGLLIHGPCLRCDIGFVAEPMIGRFGSVPVYFAEQMLFFVALIGGADAARRNLFGRIGDYFGRDSLTMLLLHGWVLVTLYPGAGHGLAHHESFYLFISVLGAILIVHATLYELFRSVLRRYEAIHFRLSGWILDLPDHFRRTPPPIPGRTG